MDHFGSGTPKHAMHSLLLMEKPRTKWLTAGSTMSGGAGAAVRNHPLDILLATYVYELSMCILDNIRRPVRLRVRKKTLPNGGFLK